MRFWDSSALVQLLVVQNAESKVSGWVKADAKMAVWWSSRVECASALQRLAREGILTRAEGEKAEAKLQAFASEWIEVDPTPKVRDSALRFLRVHALRAADALQLAAAFVAAEGNPTALEFVCLDQRLCEAAAKEGFRIVS